LQVSGDASDAERTLTVLSAELDRLAAKTVGIKIELTGEDQFLADLAAVEELATVASKEIRIPVKLDRSTFQNELRSMAAEADQTLKRAIPGGGGDRQRGPQTGMFAAIPGDAARATEEIGRGMEDATQGTEEFIRTVDRGRDGVVGFGFNLAGLGNALMFIGITILATTAPALAALAASLVGAAAAVGGMLAALGGLLGPVGLVAVGVFMGLAKALQAVAAVRQERQLGQSAAGHLAAANAALQHTRAVQQLATAQRDAGRAIRDAAHGVEIAQRNQVDAARNVQEQTVAAYRAWQDAVDGVGDAMRGLEHAELDAQRAKLDHESAVLGLRELRKELGLTGAEFDDLFSQITDVALNPAQVANLLPQVDALGLNAENVIKLKNAILDVADSSLKVRDATDNVKDSSRTFNRAQQDRNKFAREGILAFGPLRGALQGAADAQWAAARATEHYNDVAKLGVSGAPGVVAAGDALRSASQQVDASANKVKAALESVPPSFRPIIRDLDRLATAFNSVMAAPRRAATAALRPLIRGLSGMLEQFRDPIKALGDRIGRNLSGLFSGFTGDRSKGFFKQMFADAGPVLDDMTRAVKGFFGLFSNVALAGMGPLKEAAQAVADTLGTWDEKTKPGTDGAQKMHDIFEKGLTVLGKWLTLVGAVGQLVIDFFDKSAGKSGGMLDEITKLVDKVVRDLIGLFEKLSPTITDVVSVISDLVTPIASLLGDVLDTTNKLPGALGDVSTLVVAGGAFFVMRGMFRTMFGLAGRIGRVIGGWFRETGAGRFLDRLRRRIPGQVARDTAPGEGVAAGGRTAATTIAEAMVGAGREVAAMIAEACAACAGGGLPGRGRRGRERVPPEGEPPVLVDPQGRPLPPSERRPGRFGRLGRFAGRFARRLPIGGLELAGGVTAGAIGVLTGALPAAQGNSMAPYTTRVARTFQGYAAALDPFGIIPKPGSYNKQIQEMEQTSERAMQHALTRFGALQRAGLRSHSGIGTAIANQLGVTFRNLGERETGSLATLRGRFNAALGQISEDIPRHTRSWTDATSKASIAMIQGITRNVRQGRIPVGQGMDAIVETLRSKSLRGRNHVVTAFREAAGGIERWMRQGKISTQTYSADMDRITRVLFRRLGVRVDSFSRSYRTAFANLVQAGVDAQTSLFALQRSAHFGEGNRQGTSRATQQAFTSRDERPGPSDIPPRGQQPTAGHKAFWEQRGWVWNPRRRRWERLRGGGGGGRALALGGILPGFGGGDIIPALLEPGEAILRKEVVANLGAATINALNASYPSLPSVRGGYVNGGLVDTNTQRSVEQHFHIPPAAPANPQPDPEITAAQLSMHMRVQGMRL
jgi:hypothetical protein